MRNLSNIWNLCVDLFQFHFLFEGEENVNILSTVAQIPLYKCYTFFFKEKKCEPFKLLQMLLAPVAKEVTTLILCRSIPQASQVSE